MQIAIASHRPDSHLLFAVAVVVLLFTAAGFALRVNWLPGPAGTDAEEDELALPIAPGRRCAYCGWIESKREMLSGSADSAVAGVYEYTARMSDGSSRVFQEPVAATWRLGERLMVIDGAGSKVQGE